MWNYRWKRSLTFVLFITFFTQSTCNQPRNLNLICLSKETGLCPYWSNLTSFRRTCWAAPSFFLFWIRYSTYLVLFMRFFVINLLKVSATTSLNLAEVLLVLPFSEFITTLSDTRMTHNYIQKMVEKPNQYLPRSILLLKYIRFGLSLIFSLQKYDFFQPNSMSVTIFLGIQNTRANSNPLQFL